MRAGAHRECPGSKTRMSAVEVGGRPVGSAGGTITLVVAATCAGTVFEWYDFFIFGSLAAVIGAHFYSGATASQGYIFALLTFAAGFAVRPLGALVFGRFGDRQGRKRAFLVTITLMGLATVGVGLLPDYKSMGLLAPYPLSDFGRPAGHFSVDQAAPR